MANPNLSSSPEENNPLEPVSEITTVSKEVNTRIHGEQDEKYQNEIAAKEKLCRELQERLEANTRRLIRLQNSLGIHRSKAERWDRFEQSFLGKTLRTLHRTRLFLLPRGSQRERWVKQVYRVIRQGLQPLKNRLVSVRPDAISPTDSHLCSSLDRTNASSSSCRTGLKWKSPGSAETCLDVKSSEIASNESSSTKSAESGFLRSIGIEGLVSVVLPVYNHAKLLPDAIESVLAQTYRNFELLIVNDGSTDGVESVLARYARHPQVRVLTQPNQKVSAAVNNGFLFARGEFWTWTSADNLMLPEQLERQVAYLQSHPEVGMVYSDYLIIDENGEPALAPSFRPHNRYAPDDPEIHLPHSTDTLCTTMDNFIGACFLYRADSARLLGDYDPGLGIDDYDYWMRMCMAFPVAHIDTVEPLYQYRVHENSLSARAGELGIFESVHRLMDHQRHRAEYFEKPWTIYADEATLQELARTSVDVSTLVPWSGERLSCREGEKKLILVEARHLPAVQAAHSSEVVVAAWFDEDRTSPYCYRNEIRRLDAVCFAREDAILDRLALTTNRYFRFDTFDSLLLELFCHANNVTFLNATRSLAGRKRIAPQVGLFESQPRRILLQVDDFLQGGMEQVVLDLAAHLDRQRFEPILLVLGEQGPAVARAKSKGIRVVTLPKLGTTKAYRDLLHEEKISLINAHYSLFGGQIASECGIPFVQTIHNMYLWLSETQRRDYVANDPFTSAYVCVSAMVARYSDLQLGLPPEKMIVVPNGIDFTRLAVQDETKTREEVRREFGWKPDDYVFLNVASTAPVKAQRELIEAFSRLTTVHPGLRLVLLGKPADQNYFDQLKRLVAEWDLEKEVDFAGHCDHPADYYRAADVFVLPSYYEGWSLALTEAVCSGLPVIATDVGGAADLISEVGGRIIPPPYDSPDQLDLAELERHYTRHQPDFISKLAEGMESIYRERPRPKISETYRQQLSCVHTYRLYEQIFTWLLQGGRASSARSWTIPNSSMSLWDPGSST